MAIPFNRFAIYQDGALVPGLIYLAPQYYIHNNISVGLQYEADFNLVQGEASHSFMVTSDYYLTNGKNRPSVGLGVGAGNGYLVFSPRFKLHLPWIALHYSFDINTHVHSSFRLGAAITLFGKAKEKKQPKSPEEEKEEALKRYKGSKLELGGALYQIGNDDGVGFIPEGVIAYLAPQYYINNNISVGLQFEVDIFLLLLDEFFGDDNMTFMVTGDYYFGNGVIRPSLGLGVGVNSSERKSSLVLSPRFKLHLDSVVLHLGYDINTREEVLTDDEVTTGGRLGVAITLFGKKK